MKNPTHLSDLVHLTDATGNWLLEENMMVEPHPGSVVLTQGEHGTAWQRFFSDRLWHPTRGGRPKTWGQMLSHRNLVLVYDAPVRTETPAHEWVTCDDLDCAFVGQRVSGGNLHQHVRAAGV